MSAEDATTPPAEGLSEQFAEFYQQLATIAGLLNTASDKLGREIGAVDAALRKLNLGVPTWVQIGGSGSAEDVGEVHYLGYAKVNGTWGLALSVITNPEFSPREESWLFNDAPRAHRISGVDHLPALFKQLIHQVHSTTCEIQDRAKVAQSIAKAVNAAAAEAVKKGVVR